MNQINTQTLENLDNILQQDHGFGKRKSIRNHYGGHYMSKDSGYIATIYSALPEKRNGSIVVFIEFEYFSPESKISEPVSLDTVKSAAANANRHGYEEPLFGINEIRHNKGFNSKTQATVLTYKKDTDERQIISDIANVLNLYENKLRNVSN